MIYIWFYAGSWKRRLASVLCLGVAVSAGAATFVVTNANDGGDGSFRWAITNANANAGADTITFNISPGPPPFAINLVSALPALSEAVTIDATTQPEFEVSNRPVVLLNGTNVPTSANGLTLTAGGTTVRGLVIQNFAKYGIEALAATAGTNIVQGCFIGTDASGTVARTNLSGGIHIGAASDNLIGGTNAYDGNVISGNGNDGVWIETSVRNTIVGNWIGSSWGGSNSLGNGKQGVRITGGQSNRVGLGIVGGRNIISGNGESGVTIQGLGASNNVVQGNYIGLDGAGTAARGNGQYGVRLSSGARFNQLGGTNAGEGNVISGNLKSGVDLSNGAWDNSVQGNYIGTSKWGTNAVANAELGVALSAATGNQIGGSTPGARNLISGNGQSGVYLLGSGAFSNRVEGNYIGVDVTGTNRVGNGFSGVWISGAPANLIGSTLGGGGNVISGNGTGNFIHFGGVYIQGSGAYSNSVLGNFLGTDFTGTRALWNLSPDNWYHGVMIDDAPANFIGGAAAGARNIISGNNHGIDLRGTAAVGNVIQGNYIGASISGLTAIGNYNNGITIGYAGTPANTLIGGASAGSGNLIAGGNYWGIQVKRAAGTIIQGNRLGVKVDGVSALMNTVHNIDVEIPATSTTIGGTNQGEGNVIAYARGDQGWDGVRIRSGSGGTKVLGNSIHLNGASNTAGLGIDNGVDGVTLNDACDSDSGPGSIQNYPVLTNAVSDGLATVVRGFLEGISGQACLLQFYANPSPDASGYGEGRMYLGAGSVTPVTCTNAFAITLPVGVPAGWLVSATATDVANNTSEFSPALAVGTPPRVAIEPSAGQQATLGWLITNAYGGTWQLVQATNLTPPVTWADVTNTPTVASNGTWFTVTLPATNSTRFFRLLYQ